MGSVSHRYGFSRGFSGTEYTGAGMVCDLPTHYILVFEIQHWDYELHQPSQNMAVLSQKSVFENVALSKQNI